MPGISAITLCRSIGSWRQRLRMSNSATTGLPASSSSWIRSNWSTRTMIDGGESGISAERGWLPNTRMRVGYELSPSDG